MKVLFKPEAFLTYQTSKHTITLQQLKQYGGNSGSNKQFNGIEKSLK